MKSVIVYNCSKCNKSFTRKNDYTRHINKKISCDPKEKQNDNVNKRTCEYCEKIFANVNSLSRHLNGSCKYKNKKIIDDRDKEILLLKIIQEKEDQDKKINMLMEKIEEIDDIKE